MSSATSEFQGIHNNLQSKGHPRINEKYIEVFDPTTGEVAMVLKVSLQYGEIQSIACFKLDGYGFRHVRFASEATEDMTRMVATSGKLAVMEDGSYCNEENERRVYLFEDAKSAMLVKCEEEGVVPLMVRIKILPWTENNDIR